MKIKLESRNIKVKTVIRTSFHHMIFFFQIKWERKGSPFGGKNMTLCFPILSLYTPSTQTIQIKETLHFALHRTKMSKFDYPRLPRHEIVSILAESQIATVSEAELMHPNPDFISNLYTRILFHIDFLQYSSISALALPNPNSSIKF